ncbi:hypothetical protein EGP64_01980 [bacterium]|nr:hypothetical protein [bacterium]
MILAPIRIFRTGALYTNRKDSKSQEKIRIIWKKIIKTKICSKNKLTFKQMFASIVLEGDYY